MESDDGICVVCMVGHIDGYIWEGCDNCDKWYHRECLQSSVQTLVDLSLITGSGVQILLGRIEIMLWLVCKYVKRWKLNSFPKYIHCYYVFLVFLIRSKLHAYNKYWPITFSVLYLLLLMFMNYKNNETWTFICFVDTYPTQNNWNTY
jgi:hypothetical protein